MKTSTKIISGLLTGFALMMANAPTMAADVAVSIGVPGVYVEPRPVYVRPEYESDWRARRVRAEQWRAGNRHDRGYVHHDNRKSHTKHRGNQHHH